MDRIIEQKKGLKKKHIPFIIGGGLFLILVAWLIFGDHSSKMRVNSASIIVSSVEQGSFNDYIRLSGQVQPKISILLTSLESGVVERRVVNEGAIVKKGDTLLVLRNPDLVKQTRDIEAQYIDMQNSNRDAAIGLEKEKLSMQQQRLTAKIEANRAKRTFEQQQSLYSDGLTTQEEYLRAKENDELAQTNLQLLVKRLYQDSLYQQVQRVKMAQALDNMYKNVEIARRRVDDLNVRATHDGQLSSFNIQLGQNIGTGATIGLINMLDEYKVQVSIDERYIDRIVAGLGGVFERQGTEYAVEVNTLYPDVKDGQFRADFTFVGETPRNIRVGQTYYINLQLGEPTEAVLIPRGSFFASTGGKWVYVLSSDGSEAVRREIKIARQNPVYYEVIEGLQPGEKVITSSYDNFGESERLILN
ncbi:MAG: HlyD family efflux transporter periplasmic adaptor subunit [Bacteroidaceae bacterium]|nr:HlyD family efflux transporter periplasmic adaptor subunit [Bacteroidaceae bacterium]